MKVCHVLNWIPGNQPAAANISCLFFLSLKSARLGTKISLLPLFFPNPHHPFQGCVCVCVCFVFAGFFCQGTMCPHLCVHNGTWHIPSAPCRSTNLSWSRTIHATNWRSQPARWRLGSNGYDRLWTQPLAAFVQVVFLVGEMTVNWQLTYNKHLVREIALRLDRIHLEDDAKDKYTESLSKKS